MRFKERSSLYTTHECQVKQGFPSGSDNKESICNEGDLVQSLGWESWRREWQPTPVFLPGDFHGQKRLVGYSPWVAKNQTLTKQL